MLLNKNRSMERTSSAKKEPLMISATTACHGVRIQDTWAWSYYLEVAVLTTSAPVGVAAVVAVVLAHTAQCLLWWLLVKGWSSG